MHDLAPATPPSTPTARTSRTPRVLRASLVLALALGAAACSSSDDDDTGSGTSGLAGVVAGAADMHCVVDGTPKVVTVDPNACTAGTHGEATDGGDVHAHSHALHGEHEFATMYNASGTDDWCKYALSWSADRTGQNVDVTFTLTARHLATDAAVSDAEPFIEAFLDDTHPAPNSDATSTEKAPGVYEIGPMRFDAAGDWTVRFHLHHECADTETSPHGHGAFFFRVP